MGVTSMLDRVTAQVEIITTERGDTFDTTDVHRRQVPHRMLAMATFFWQADEDWIDFTQKVTRCADKMFAELDDQKNVTQYIQFKTGGVL